MSVVVSQQTILHSYMEMGVLIITWGHVFVHMRETDQQLRGFNLLGTCRWCDIILNVHASTEDENFDTNDSFYEKLERAFDQFSKYYMKIL
jgi:hypothetical protein